MIFSWFLALDSWFFFLHSTFTSSTNSQAGFPSPGLPLGMMPRFLAVMRKWRAFVAVAVNFSALLRLPAGELLKEYQLVE